MALLADPTVVGMSQHAAAPTNQGTTLAGTPAWRQVAWPTAVVLAALALARPVVGVVARANDVQLGRWGVGIVAAVSLVWVAVVACRRIAAVPTLVAAGLVQALGASMLALVSRWVFDGVPGGPLTRPVALAGALAAGALWGLVCGALALALQRARTGYGPAEGRA